MVLKKVGSTCPAIENTLTRNVLGCMGNGIVYWHLEVPK